MNVKELRIGNWVLDSDRENPYLHQVVRIESEEYTIWNSGDDYNIVVKIEGSEDGYFDMKASPIPLSEELLVRFGAVYSHTVISIKMYKINDYYVAIREEGFRFIHKSTNTGAYEPIKDLKYVHQLQNLYFSLTGTELEIK